MEKERIFEELKHSQIDVRFIGAKETYVGKVQKIGFKNIYVCPYLVFENLPTDNGRYINIARIEKKISLPLQKKILIPEKLSPGYIENFARRFNYFSAKQIKEPQIIEMLFQNMPFPNEEQKMKIDGLLEIRDSQPSSYSNYKGSEKIGFRIGKKE